MLFRRRKQVMLSFFCALFLTLWLPVNLQAKELDLYATSAVLLDGRTGRVLYEKNANQQMAMASTTKIMTCILVLEMGDLQDDVKISAYAESMPKVKLNLHKNETYKVKDLLHSLMLESHNDTAVALAEYIGKEYLCDEIKQKDVSEYNLEESKMAVAAFARLMTAKAIEIGCQSTYFVTPNGLDATESIYQSNGETILKEHSTTAVELGKIMAYCILYSPKSHEFIEITSTKEYTFQANQRSFYCTNHNSFLTMMPGAISGKTGFTNKAGYCYVGALESDDRIFVVALLACGWPNNKSYKWSDTKKLMQYGMEHFAWRSLEDEKYHYKEDKLLPIMVEEGCNDILGVIPKASVSVTEKKSNTGWGENSYGGVLMREEEEIQVECHQETSLKAPVKKGTVVGNIQYKLGEVVYKEESIVVAEDIPKIDFLWCFRKIMERFTRIFVIL